jgi:hypothetical protein
MNKFGSFVLATLFVAMAFQSLAQERIVSSEAARYVGKKAKVCGQLASVNYAQGSKGRPRFLNLDKGYPDQKFMAVIWGEDRDKFSKPPEVSYAGKNLRNRDS